MATFLTEREFQSILCVKEFLEQVKRDVQSLVLSEHPFFTKYNEPVEIISSLFKVPRSSVYTSCSRAININNNDSDKPSPKNCVHKIFQ